MGSQPTTTSQSSGTRDPWAAQQPYLLDAFSQAQNAYNTTNAQGAYGGNYVAPTNDNQYSAYNNAYDFANGQGSNAVNGLLSNGSSMTNTGMSGATGALTGLNNFTGTDQTANNVANAGQYANNPYISSMVDASMADATRNASESTLPNLYRGAAASGNLNSDRTALAQGVVDRGLGEKAADVSANLRGSAYGTGINAALQGNQQNLSGLNAMGALGQSMNTTGLGAMLQGINGQGALNTMAQGGANGVQGLDQSGINNALQQYQGQQNFPWSNLQKYYGIIGGQNWGGQTTGTATETKDPGTMAKIGQGLDVAGMLMCDARVKNIHYQTDQTFHGLPMYRYNYHGDERLFEGPIAQEVEAAFPDAIVEIGGVKHINLNYF